MGLNWLDVAGNLAVGAIDKNEQYRQEELKASMEELKQNKEFYRALATTRYSKDLDRYYKEKEKYDNQISTYEKIQSANGGKGMSKNMAAQHIIMADPELAAMWTTAGTGKYGAVIRQNLLNQVITGFKDTMGQIKVGEKAVGPGGQEKEDIMKEGVTGWEFSHPELNIQAPKKADYYKGDEFWKGLRKEIESESQGPLTKEFIKLFGWKNKDKSEAAADMIDSIDDIKGTEIKEMIMADGKSVPKKYSSSNVSKEMQDIFNLTGSSGQLLSNYDVDGVDHELFKIAKSDRTRYKNKEYIENNMYSILSQMPKDWIDTYLVEDDWANKEVRFKGAGEKMASQVRNFWHNVVDHHFNNTFMKDGLYQGNLKEFTHNAIQGTFVKEFDKRHLVLNNDSLWEVVESIPLIKNKDFEISYLVGKDQIPLVDNVMTDDGKKYFVPVWNSEDLEEHIFNDIKTFVEDGARTISDVRGLEAVIQNSISNFYGKNKEDIIKNSIPSEELSTITTTKKKEPDIMVVDGNIVIHNKNQGEFLIGEKYPLEKILQGIETGQMKLEDQTPEIQEVIKKYLVSEEKKIVDEEKEIDSITTFNVDEFNKNKKLK
jgi:hypothetical protein